MNMKHFTAALAAAIALTATAKTSTPEGWTDDYDAALKRAAEENKLVLADFSGSDWCGWCKKLDKEVFVTEEFKKGAADKFVLLMVDSPQDKSLLSDKAKEQNPKLVKKYDVNGFPTVLILDEKGEVVAQTGYQKGGPVKYLQMLESKVKTEGDPEYRNVVKPLVDKAKAAQEAFDKGVQKSQRTMMARALRKNLPALKKALAELEATEVDEKFKAGKEEAIAPLAEMVKDIEKFLKENEPKKPAKKANAKPGEKAADAKADE